MFKSTTILSVRHKGAVAIGGDGQVTLGHSIMKDNARKSAELIIAEAEVKAEKILNNAHNRLAQLHEDISELKRQRTQIEVQIGSSVEAHSKLLELSKEGAKAIDEEDAKLKLLKQAR